MHKIAVSPEIKELFDEVVLLLEKNQHLFASKPAKKIYFARHGLSEMNVAGLFAGHTDTSLTSEGRKQAKIAGRKAKADGLKFDAIIASPLKRAHETAKLIARELDFPHGQIITNDLLKERDFGELEGTPYDFPREAHIHDPRLLDQFPGVESLNELHERAQKFLDWLETLEQQTVLLVGHGAIGRAIRRLLEGKKPDEQVDQFENAIVHQLA